MNDIKTELVELIKMGFIGVNGVKVLVDQCYEHDSESYVENDNWMISIVKREYRPFSIEKIAQHLREEINNDIMFLHSNGITVDRMALFLKEVPCSDSNYSIKYIKAIRKK